MHLIMSFLGNKWSLVFLGRYLYCLALIMEGLLSFKQKHKQKVTLNRTHGWSNLLPYLDESKLKMTEYTHPYPLASSREK